ncbi:hypothetical protein B0J18DRAFT_418921 [Chaetomium sp. MPI-SDFR-AT-0129]|nr:hypothetical protein B0J18DRAFT_418921 [Chaetomium sp. MPI-SDFR-AT-0129]
MDASTLLLLWVAGGALLRGCLCATTPPDVRQVGFQGSSVGDQIPNYTIGWNHFDTEIVCFDSNYIEFPGPSTE